MIESTPFIGTLPPPILVIGCHRSGTTVVTKLLRDSGIFFGADLDANLESRFFADQNSFVLRACGGCWDWPETVSSLLSDKPLTSGMQAYLQRALARHGRRRTVGPAGSSGMWGWKDPRTTLLLPLWLEIFPDARVIWVTRHGVDVAQSLLNRERANAKDIATRLSQHRGRRADHRLERRLQQTMQYSFRCTSLTGAFDVWSNYEQTAIKHTVDATCLHMRFESLAEDAFPHLKELLRFCGVEPEESHISRLASQLDIQRSLAYRRDAELAAFAETHSAELAQYGY
jgi:hypothetical protein